MKTNLAQTIGSIVAKVSRILGRGTGVTWGGEIALRIDPQFVVTTTRRINNRILVAGTNGKTTTAALIAHVLAQENFTVIHNKTGANLLNGIAGTIVQKYDKIESKSICIFETDEAAFPEVVNQIKPTIVVLLNLFRDQLDRYGEVDSVAAKWKKVTEKLPVRTMVIANADDPLIAHISSSFKGKILYFGLNDPSLKVDKVEHAADSSYCLKCNAMLKYHAIYLSHQGDWYCLSCGETRPELALDTAVSSLKGVYNLYNTLAATLVLSQFKISSRIILEHFSSFLPVFGRQEEFEKNGKKITLILSKNPTGFNESMRTALTQKDAGCFLFVLNDKIPDGTDVSWIWDMDIEMLTQPIPIICTGDRAYDMGLRIKYSAGQKSKESNISNSSTAVVLEPNFVVEKNLRNALHMGLEKTKKGQKLYILATYSAMLEVRKILTGKKIS